MACLVWERLCAGGQGCGRDSVARVDAAGQDGVGEEASEIAEKAAGSQQVDIGGAATEIASTGVGWMHRVGS